jgi:site-specific recombinase XerD
MAWIEVEGWRAGRVWQGKNGRLSFYIRRDGRDVATGASTLPGALTALERFEKTGIAKSADPGPVILDVELAREFLAASKAKANSVEWRRSQRQHLDWWQDKLGGRDLRAGRIGSVTTADIRSALDGAPSARQREAVLRSLYTYLRGTDRIATAEDPTYGKPRIAPPSRPAQETIDKAIDAADLETTLGYLDAAWAARGDTDEERDRRGRRWGDLLRLLDGTGMHVSEAVRFAGGGRIEALPDGRKATEQEAAVLVVPLHKSGAPYRVAVSAATAKVAERVRSSGSFSEAVFYSVLRKAAEATGAKVLPGRFRHTVATAAVNSGATIEQVGNFLGHKSAATTRKFYATHGVPVKVPTRR